ncbi:MAG: hypothetical protein H6737_03995 [Alphaproteobacteria bacterium]|nr:hypothetical protein [Alphaproteobacteria bacterium]
MLREALRDDDRRRLQALSPLERMELAARAGRMEVELYARHQGLTLDEALSHLERNKQRGRTPSACAVGA